YVMLLKKALANMGLADRVPVISLNFLGMDDNPGFRITLSMSIEAIRSFVYGDMLMLLKNQTLPYELDAGSAEALCDLWAQKLTEQFRVHKGLTFSALKKNLAAIAADSHALPQDRSRKKTKVGIVGDIYVKYSSFGNNGLEKTLHSLDCETMVPGALGFFQYCLANAEANHLYYGGNPIKPAVSLKALHVTEHWEEAMAEALEPYPEFVVPPPFPRLRTLAEQVIDPGVKMGEGWLLAGETAALIESGYENIVCAQPFGCLPNHIVGKGTVRRLRELYPKANIFPVDYDAGASRVNQENRIRLMLAIAGENEANEDNRP
ncbi:MAG: 2-hydroxyglutaryl-CoA dehydratase, partial [Clostridia bacterium]|nr:2-hydroxyglutaryl-CoA dehydratase [Clostridia bacterium]